ncbi:transposase [Tissierella praeacuta]|uniref:transposase n=1 Tax=Tissierella praeacuta TaxID=43131 RepID=UPI002FDA673D
MRKLNKVLSAYPLFNKIYQVVLKFKDILKGSNPNNLNSWIEEAKQLEINEINRDIDAVKNAITYSYSNGLVEGNVNKIKVIKRIMYGRCNFAFKSSFIGKVKDSRLTMERTNLGLTLTL